MILWVTKLYRKQRIEEDCNGANTVKFLKNGFYQVSSAYETIVERLDAGKNHSIALERLDCSAGIWMTL
jgi:hypothetical protein